VIEAVANHFANISMKLDELHPSLYNVFLTLNEEKNMGEMQCVSKTFAEYCVMSHQIESSFALTSETC
jgi:hypothetical protein